MITVYCDRCGNDVVVPNYVSVCICRQIASKHDHELDLCEQCADALGRFLGIDKSGFEKLDSEIKEEGSDE